MKIVGKRNHPILGEIDNVIIEESDFNFYQNWDELSIDKKADFCSFLKHPTISRETVSMWEYYQLKEKFN